MSDCACSTCAADDTCIDCGADLRDDCGWYIPVEGPAGDLFTASRQEIGGPFCEACKDKRQQQRATA